MCSWSNTQNVKVDKLDWELTCPAAERHYSTPPEDHTLGTEKGKKQQHRDERGRRCFMTQRVFPFFFFTPGHFLFFPSSNRTAANQNAQLLSPHLPPTGGTCLKFWVYKPFSCKKFISGWADAVIS